MQRSIQTFRNSFLRTSTIGQLVVNPRGACAARVIVVAVCVCLRAISLHEPSIAPQTIPCIQRRINIKICICGVFSETSAFGSYVIIVFIGQWVYSCGVAVSSNLHSPPHQTQLIEGKIVIAVELNTQGTTPWVQGIACTGIL